MPENESASPLPAIHADDQEIKRYADLLDSLNIGLWVFSTQQTCTLVNRTATALSGNTPPELKDASGFPLAEDDLPHNIVKRTSRPLFERTFTLTNHRQQTVWLSINALPVFSAEGQVRRTLVTLTDISKRRQTQDDTEQRLTRDPLTGVYNQQHLMYLLDNEIHRARRYGTPFSLAQIDIDHFEALCAEYGHEQGEALLGELGQLFIDSLREIDIVGRIAHDVFMIVLPNVGIKDALIGLERLRILIENRPLTDRDLKITFSGGITEYTGENPEALIERIRALLHHARATGRNRFCLDMDIL